MSEKWTARHGRIQDPHGCTRVVECRGAGLVAAKKLGKLYRWTPNDWGDSSLCLTLVSESAEVCGAALECGSTCCLAPDHDGGCSCCGDTNEPGDCPA